MCLGIDIGCEVKLLTCMHTKELHEKLVYFDKNGYCSYRPLIIKSLILSFLFKNYMSFFFMLDKFLISFECEKKYQLISKFSDSISFTFL